MTRKQGDNNPRKMTGYPMVSSLQSGLAPYFPISKLVMCTCGQKAYTANHHCDLSFFVRKNDSDNLTLIPDARRPQFFSVESLGVKLQFTIDIFFRTAILWKLFDIRFSYKHCNFSRICLLVKMTSKTVTRSIV